MAWFNQTAEYLGERVEKIFGAGGGRLTVRSVKIFADGMCTSMHGSRIRLTHINRKAPSGPAVLQYVRALFYSFRFLKKFQLYEPYADNSHTHGFMRIDPELLNKVVPRFLREGWQVVSELGFLPPMFFI